LADEDYEKDLGTAEGIIDKIDSKEFLNEITDPCYKKFEASSDGWKEAL